MGSAKLIAVRRDPLDALAAAVPSLILKGEARGSTAGVVAPPTRERGEALPRTAGDDEPTGGVVILGAPRESETANERPDARRLHRGVVALVAATIVFGILLRAWFLFHTGIDSDQAIVGLMAHNYLHGHLTAFYWGQQYGGVEGYAVAALFRITGESTVSLGMVAVLFSAAGAILVWRIARRVVSDPNIAILAGALAWAAPLALVFKSTVEYGLRGATLVCGLGLVLFALRILDGETRLRDFVALGLLAGIGWWSLPEIAYFLLPGTLLVVGAIVRSGRSREWWARRLGVALLAAFVGALPWLWANVNSGLASINPHRFPGNNTPLNPGYVGRLRTIFGKGIPAELGLRLPGVGYGSDPTNRWVLGKSSLSHALLVVLVIAVVACIGTAIVLCVVRGGRALAIAAALVVFPFLAAAQPGTWFWQDGRYLVYLGPLLTIVLAIGCDEGARRWASRRRENRAASRGGMLAFGSIVVAAVSITGLAFHVATHVGPSNFASDWSGRDADARKIASLLHDEGVHFGYANYWVAYKLDFLSHGKLAVTVGVNDTNRSTALDEAVRRADDAAWLFVPIAHATVGYGIFGATEAIRGPDAISERQFLDGLARMHVGYRLVHAGPIDAVIPARPVAPDEFAAL